MQGVNEFRLNRLTMKTIVQEWIDREFKAKPIVSDVSFIGNDGGCFVVRTTDPAKDSA